jgi:hypothetical protein
LEIRDGLTVAVFQDGTTVGLHEVNSPNRLRKVELVRLALRYLGTGQYWAKENEVWLASRLAGIPRDVIARVNGEDNDDDTGDSEDGGHPPLPEAKAKADVSPETLPTDLGQALDVLRKLFGTPIDEATVRQLVTDEVNRLNGRPVVVKVGELPEVKVSGRTHRQFPELLRKVSARCHLFLTGSAGVGKTFVVSQIAEALGLPMVTVSADPLPQRAEILGGVSPVTGQVIKGAIREIYETGGIFLLDEWDTGHTSLGTSLNKLLSSDSYDFPVDGGGTATVRKHKDFVVVATGNTYGQGGSLRYVGTNRINGASLDRFTLFHVDTDEDLEAHIATSIHAVHGKAVHEIVRKARANAVKYTLDVIVSPRATYDATKFMVAGDTLEQALRGRLFGRGLPTDQESKLLEGISF